MFGTIRRVMEESRGFGFIKPDNEGPDLFFHATQLRGLEFGDHLRNMRVCYDIEEVNGRDRAINVEKQA